MDFFSSTRRKSHQMLPLLLCHQKHTQINNRPIALRVILREREIMWVQVGFGCFFSSPAEIRASLCVFICLWAVTFSPPILNSNISPFPPAISRLRCMHIYEVHFHALFLIYFLAPVCNECRGEGGNNET